MKSLARLQTWLAESNHALLSAAVSIPPDRWRQKPPGGGWSAGEVLAHLRQSEQMILDGLRRMQGRGQTPPPPWKRLHLSPWLVQWRLRRVHTPVPLDPALVGEKDEMLEQSRAVRKQTFEWMKAIPSEEMSRIGFPHPFLGRLNGRAWMRLIGYHEIRHTKQVREIARDLR